MIGATVTLHATWQLAAVVLLLPYAVFAAWWGGGEIGNGPDYTTRENLGGTVMLVGVLAFLGLLAWAVLILGGMG